MTVYAAGVILWKPSDTGMEVALVHREKYDDWAFAKGKQDPGELLPETAVREVEEETGIKIRLGRKLSVVNYSLSTGEDKEVHYWVSKVPQKAINKSRFTPNDEIAEVRWLTTQKALETLSYQHDRDLLEKVIAFNAANELETRGLIVLRHAMATPRSEWTGEEVKRPLLKEGSAQAKRLLPLLSAYGPKRVVSSPWKRCRDTVMPFVDSRKRVLVERSQLSEYGSAKNPKSTSNVIEDLFADSKNALVCTHRPALPNVLKAISDHAVGSLKLEIEAAKTLQPADFLVLRLSLDKKPRVLSTEYVSLESGLSR